MRIYNNYYKRSTNAYKSHIDKKNHYNKRVINVQYFFKTPFTLGIKRRCQNIRQHFVKSLLLWMWPMKTTVDFLNYFMLWYYILMLRYGSPMLCFGMRFGCYCLRCKRYTWTDCRYGWSTNLHCLPYREGLFMTKVWYY